ncbi:MAG TPA: hypothetical protein VIL36_06240 [Acidimicrobiales bacterium]
MSSDIETARRSVVAAGGDGVEAVEEFVGGLQAALDAFDADAYNRQFAEDVLWGSPFGMIVRGYDEIHAIHTRMLAAAHDRGDAGSRYEIEDARRIADDVAIAYVRRRSLAEAKPPADSSDDADDADHTEDAQPQPGRAAGFDELALFVLVRRDGAWWLAAGLHTPDRRDVYRAGTP